SAADLDGLYAMLREAFSPAGVILTPSMLAHVERVGDIVRIVTGALRRHKPADIPFNRIRRPIGVSGIEPGRDAKSLVDIGPPKPRLRPAIGRRPGRLVETAPEARPAGPRPPVEIAPELRPEPQPEITPATGPE